MFPALTRFCAARSLWRGAEVSRSRGAGAAGRDEGPERGGRCAARGRSDETAAVMATVSGAFSGNENVQGQAYKRIDA